MGRGLHLVVLLGGGRNSWRGGLLFPVEFLLQIADLLLERLDRFRGIKSPRLIEAARGIGRPRRQWRAQYDIDRSYAHADDNIRTEEGVAHAYADWATGKIKVDGRIARLFKRIKAFFEALRNALHGLGFKSAEDVFRDIRSGEIGSRERENAGHETADEQLQLAMRERARSLTKSLTSTRIVAPRSLFGWLRLRQAPFHANYTALFNKHSEYFASPEQVRDHVESVLSNANLAVETRPEPQQRVPHLAIVADLDAARVIVVRAELRGGVYDVRSAYILTKRQIPDMVSGARRAGAQVLRRNWQSARTPDSGSNVNDRLEKGGSQGDGNDEEPRFELRREAAAEPAPTPNLNRRIRGLIEQALDSDIAHKVVENFQDLSHPVKLLQNELERRRAAPFEDPESFYVRKRLYPGRVAGWTDSFNRQHLDPLVKLLKTNGISRREAADYLYALHAPERNAAMDKINPALKGAGSGMSDHAAAQIRAAAEKGPKAAAYQELRQRVAVIRDLILDVMEKGGLEKPEVIAAWRHQYKDYVPLRGWEVAPEDAPPEYRGPGVGFNVRGKEVQQAFGRRSKADDPLVNLLDQAYRTFDRAERNRYLQSLYRALDDLAEAAEDIATLDRGKPKREIDPATGLARTVETSNQYLNPKAVYLKFDGNPHFIVFRDQNLAEAVKRMSPDDVGAFRSILVLQNKLKAIWTHYSPAGSGAPSRKPDFRGI